MKIYSLSKLPTRYIFAKNYTVVILRSLLQSNDSQFLGRIIYKARLSARWNFDDLRERKRLRFAALVGVTGLA